MTIIDPFRPKEYPYEQIIWGSTQKSINTGSSGFGLRTHSPGLTSEEAAEIAQLAMVNYSLPTAQKATESDILATPLIEDRYPSLYTFREVTLSNGKKVWVVGRTLYVVSDYGFFADIDSARRDGSNYIAHLAVFNEQPDITALAAMIRQNKFLPADKRLTPANTEIRALLVGEPMPLPTGEISFFRSDYDNNTFLTEVALGLLTAMYRNRHAGEHNSVEAKKLVVRLDDKYLPDLLYTLSHLPENLTRNLQFQANTLYYTGVPEDLDMIVVPSQNTTRIDEEFFIVVDYTKPVPRVVNLLESSLFDHIRKSADNGIIFDRDDTIALCANGGLEESDPELAYWARRLITNDGNARLGELTGERIVQLLHLKSLNEHERNILYDKLNNYLNDYFYKSLHLEYTANTLREGLDILNTLRREAPDMIRISQESVRFVSDRLFARPEYFGKLFREASQNERLDAALYILNEAEEKVPRVTVMQSLRMAENPQIWRQMLNYIAVSGKPEYAIEVMKDLIASPMNDKAKFIKELYSPKQYMNIWFQVFNELSDQELIKLGFPEIIEFWLTDADSRRELLRDDKARKLLSRPDLLTQTTCKEIQRIIDVAERCIPDSVNSKLINEAVTQYGPDDEYTEAIIRKWLEQSKKKEDFINQMNFLYLIGTSRYLAKWFETYRWPLLTSDKSRQDAIVILID
ncbi:MAG: hypothetical protein K2K26_08645, partial [Muribaculaceae bacterium]|nr:hypothetical protein [Muribaculaceae bacterium]